MQNTQQNSQTKLEEAQEMLDCFREAIKAAAIGNKSYTINGRSIMRYSMKELREQFDFWQAEVDRINAGMTSQTRVGRLVPWG